MDATVGLIRSHADRGKVVLSSWLTMLASCDNLGWTKWSSSTSATKKTMSLSG